jgi:geranylgeranyl pyrophosphate synthase
MRGGPRLADVNGQGTAALDPIAATEAIAYDFLAKGGKYSRPFITLAAYDALTGGNCTHPDGAKHVVSRITDAVRRAAMSIEAFHKASLVHDDIQDGDEFRYGQPTLHMEHGVPTAINVGDYLIGLGYRLVSRDTNEIGADTAADILNKLAEAHTKLSEGQGAELVWRDSRDKRITPAEALKIYALKTAPAFEAALYSGMRLAGPADGYDQPATHLARHLGIAFQILNDLQDWQGDDFNKLTLGGDVLGGRPTVLWALALEGLEDQDRRQLEQLVAEGAATPAVFADIRRLFDKAGAFDGAQRLVAHHRQQAESVADQLEPAALSRLAKYLIETVLARPAAAGSTRAPLAVPSR